MLVKDVGAVGASVRLVAIPLAGAPVAERLLITDGTGGFDFGISPALMYVVTAGLAGHEPGVAKLDLRKPQTQPPSDALVLHLVPCQFELFGHIADAEGIPIVTARVVTDRGFGVDAQADGKGGYRICISGNESEIMASAIGYGSLIYKVRPSSASRLDITLVPEAVVAGTVHMEGSGDPVSGALIRVLPRGRGQRIPASARGFSAADGRFEIFGLSPGQYRVDAQADGFVGAAPIEFTLRATERLKNLRCVLRSSTTLDGAVQEGDRGVVGATVVAMDMTAMIRRTAVTQVGGQFSISGMSLGTVDLKVDGYRIVGRDTVDLAAKSLGPVHLQVTALGTVRGRVLRNGVPVPVATISAQGGGAASFWARADRTGSYALEGMLSGIYRLQATDPTDGARGEIEGVVVTEATPKEGVDILLSHMSRVSGVVQDDSGQAVAGVFVLLIRADRSEQGTGVTSASGSFDVSGLSGEATYQPEIWESPSGAQKLAAAHPPFPVVHLAKKGDRAAGLKLVVTGAKSEISGKVLDDDGTGVPDVQVEGMHGEQDAEPQFYGWADLKTATTNGRGEFVLSGLRSGQYALRATADAGRQGLQRAVASGARGVVIRLQGSGRIEGTVSGFTGTPTVYASQFGTVPAVTIPAAVTGAGFSIAKLGVGRYRVSAIGPGGSDATDVDLKSSAVAHVELKAKTGRSVDGRVTELRTGRPVVGMRCSATLRASAERLGQEIPGATYTNAEGAFLLTGLPLKPVAVECLPQSDPMLSDGVVMLPESAEGRQRISVLVVRQERSVLLEPGITFDMTLDALRVTAVRPGGPADRAGIKPGDAITNIDGQALDRLTLSGSVIVLQDREPGVAAELSLVRNGKANPMTLPFQNNQAPSVK